jgi:hypothetical protein
VSPSSPAIVSAASAQRLPRWVLLLLGLLYIAPGLLGREAWKPIDGTSVGIMLDLAQGHADWWAPSLLGQAVGEAAWLPYWLGAWAIQALPGLDPVTASRLPLAAALALTLVGTWNTAFSLALQRTAQPVAFAFGGHAEPVAYARAVADTALLALLACLGLAVMGHEASPHPYAMAASAWLLHAGAQAQRQARLDWRWGLRWLLPTLALMASGAPGTAVALAAWAARPASGAALRQAQSPTREWTRWALQSLLVLGLYLGLDWPHDTGQPPLGAVSHLWNALKATAWQAWPAWPLALLGLWAWRRHLRTPHIAVPLGAALLLWLSALAHATPARQMLPLLTALAPLAGLAVPTIRRNALALVDWLALLMFSLCGLVIWVYGLAMATGWPAAAARAVERLLPALDTSPTPLAWALACVVTGLWLWAIRWRTRAHRVALWKGLVLSATGTTWCWALLMSIWLPPLNHGMGFDRLAQRIQSIAAAERCAYSVGLPPALNAALLRAGLRPEIEARGATTCDALITTPDSDLSATDAAAWQPVASLWQVDQRADPVLIYRRRP